MKYAIAHDYGSEGWVFETGRGEEGRLLFDTFGEAYKFATTASSSSGFEVFGVFAPEDIKVTVEAK